MPRTFLHGLARTASVLGLLCGLAIATPATAAPVYTVIHNFNGADGMNPQGGLLQDKNHVLYGETLAGGANGAGDLWALTSNGSAFADLYDFNGTDGVSPFGGLRNIFGDIENLPPAFGVTNQGGVTGLGTVFGADLAGHVRTTHVFTGNPDGAFPEGRLLPLSDGHYYGTTSAGGNSDNGIVYRVRGNGTGYQVLHRFSGIDGSGPSSGLQYGTDGALYGTTIGGGKYNSGVVYRISPGGSLRILWNFSQNGLDGNSPIAALVTDFKGNLYGTTTSGGAGGNGTIFRITQSGVFTTLYAFAADGSTGQNAIGQMSITGENNQNLNAVAPFGYHATGSSGAVILYGTTQDGGPYSSGLVFSFAVATGTYTIQYAFTGLSDGANPYGKLVTSSDGNLYGTTQNGGLNGDGVVFSLGGVLPGSAYPFSRTRTTLRTR